MTDRELLAEYVSSGSAEAFDCLVERHSAMVYSACLRVLSDRHAAEDAAQATFVTFMRRAKSLSAHSLGAWLYMTAIGAAKTLRRSSVRRSKHERDAETMNTTATPNTRDDTLWSELKSHLDAALTVLPAPQRDAVVLRYLNGRTEAEAAQQLGCSERTLRARVAYGLEKLRDRLGRQGVTVSGAVLAGLLAERSIETLPAGLAAKLTASALSHTASAAAKSAASAVLKKVVVANTKSIVVTAIVTLTTIAAAVYAIALNVPKAQPANTPSPAVVPPATPIAPATPVKSVILFQDDFETDLSHWIFPTGKGARVQVQRDGKAMWAMRMDPSGNADGLAQAVAMLDLPKSNLSEDAFLVDFDFMIEGPEGGFMSAKWNTCLGFTNADGKGSSVVTDVLVPDNTEVRFNQWRHGQTRVWIARENGESVVVGEKYYDNTLVCKTSSHKAILESWVFVRTHDHCINIAHVKVTQVKEKPAESKR